MRGWRAGAAFAGCLLAAVVLGGWGAGSAAGEFAAAQDKPRLAASVHVTKQEGEDPDEEAKIIAALEAQGYFRPEVPLSYPLQDALHTACERYGVEYTIALGLIEVESNFDPAAVNPNSGCYGLCQLSPRYFPRDLSPAENLEAGIAYLGAQLARYGGDIQAALTAYHDGYDTGRRGYANAVLTAAERWRRET